jgi:hypothetical protein
MDLSGLLQRELYVSVVVDTVTDFRCLENVAASTPHNPVDLSGLLQRELYVSVVVDTVTDFRFYKRQGV